MKRLFIAVLGAVFLWALYAAYTRCDSMDNQYRLAYTQNKAIAGVGISDIGLVHTFYAGRGGFTLFINPDANTACILDSGPMWKWAIEYAI